MGTFTTKCVSSGAKQIPQVVEWFITSLSLSLLLICIVCLLPFTSLSNVDRPFSHTFLTLTSEV